MAVLDSGYKHAGMTLTGQQCMGIRKAQSYMQLANNEARLKSADSAHLSIGNALKYLSSPDEKVDPLENLIAPNLDYVVQFYPEILGVHDVCRIFPMMQPEEFRDFARSISEYGLMEPITLTPDGLLIDGKIRLIACYVTHTPIKIETTTLDPAIHATAMNLIRKSLTKDQIAMGKAKYKAHLAEEAANKLDCG